jgi:hypothetical protein
MNSGSSSIGLARSPHVRNAAKHYERNWQSNAWNVGLIGMGSEASSPGRS